MSVEALPGLRAAALVRDQVTEALCAFAGRARTDGATWQMIADELGVVDPAGQRAAAELAFEHLTQGVLLPPMAERPSRSLYGPIFYWECRHCTELILDQGPYQGHPDSQEHGHADDCGRRAAAVRAFEAEASGG